MMDKFLLIDGSSLIHRAFFALPQLTNSRGVPTGAVYGLCTMLLKLLTDVQPRYMAVAFDKSRKTFRTELYAAYKGQRKATPSELSEQFPLAERLLKELGIAALELDNYEADDIIGTFAKKAPENVEVIIVTGDRDELQLVDKRTKVYFTKKGITDIQVFDEAEFARCYEGLVPEQLVELKGLMGDASDNIPGVPGVGPKTALKLIKTYGTVENVLQNLEAVEGKSLKTKLANNQESARLSRRLAEIFKEVPLDTELEHYQLRPLGAGAEAVLLELEFRNMYTRFEKILGSERDEVSLFSLVKDAEEGEAGAEKEAGAIVLTEFNQADFFERLFKESQPVPFVATITGCVPTLEFSDVEFWLDAKSYVLPGSLGKDSLRQWLKDDTLKKITTDSKEIYKCCLCQGFKAAGIVEDVAIAGYVCNPGESSYSLDALSLRYLDGKYRFAASALAPLAGKLGAVLRERCQEKLYRELELPLAFVLAEMECLGITPDMKLLEELNRNMAARVADLEAVAISQAGEQFNLKSPKQLGTILFEKLKLPVIKKTKTGYSTDVSVLEELEGLHPLVATILEHRKLAKLKSTYLDGLKPLVNPTTGRIHTHFQQTVTVTGRLSSTDPNLQNIPTRTEEGRQIRRIFVPAKGFSSLMSCDYSQVELRILACIAQDKLLLEAFRHAQDIHARTAAEVFATDIEHVTPEMRSRAKAVNFGIVYGISDFGLARQIQVSRKEAAGFIASYFARYTGVKNYMEEIVALAGRQGYVTTLMGRRRYLPDIRSSNFNLRKFAERTAINTPIQGTAADIMKKAMLDVARALQEAGLRSRMLLQVHDELVCEVYPGEEEELAGLVKAAMEGAATLEIPLIAEVKFGANWSETK